MTQPTCLARAALDGVCITAVDRPLSAADDRKVAVRWGPGRRIADDPTAGAIL